MSMTFKSVLAILTQFPKNDAKTYQATKTNFQKHQNFCFNWCCPSANNSNISTKDCLYKNTTYIHQCACDIELMNCIFVTQQYNSRCSLPEFF